MGLFDIFKNRQDENSGGQEDSNIKLKMEEFSTRFPNLNSRKLTVQLNDSGDVFKMEDTSKFLYEHWNGWPLIHDDKLNVFPKEIFFQTLNNKSEFSAKSLKFVLKLITEEEELWNSPPQKVDIDEFKDFLNEFYSLLPKLDHTNYYFTAYDFQLNWETTGKILLKDSDFTTGHTYSATMDDENKNKARVWDESLNKWIYIDIYDRMIYTHYDRSILVRKRHQSDNIISLYRRVQELTSYAKENKLILYWEFHQC